MPVAQIDDVEIAYVDEGEGQAIVLIHGFASSKEANWIDTGWVKWLTDAGYRVIAFDNRGHGESSKFHDAAHYSLELMARDAIGLIRHLGLKQPNVMGYSMGARISAWLLMHHGRDLSKVVLAGNGASMIEGSGDWTPVREALLAPSLADVSDPRGRAFRKFADQTKSDLVALAECVTAVRQVFAPEDFEKIANSVLIAIGTEDDIAGSGQVIADLIPRGKLLEIPGRDHMRAVGDPVYKQGVVDFLDG